MKNISTKFVSSEAGGSHYFTGANKFAQQSSCRGKENQNALPITKSDDA
jgi:hypothetical protein